MGILTEEELNKYLRYSKQDIGLSKILSDKVINSHIASLERNRNLVLENDEQNARIQKLEAALTDISTHVVDIMSTQVYYEAYLQIKGAAYRALEETK